MASAFACATALLTSSVRAEETAEARSYVPPPTFSYWSGTERTQSGELSIAAARPFEGGGLAPARDTSRTTTTYVRGAYAGNRNRNDAQVLELASVHDLPAAATGSVRFIVDARATTAITGQGRATIPWPRAPGVYVVPSLGVGNGAHFSPLALADVELWTDRRKSYGATFGAEVTRWTHDRTRALAEVAALARLSGRVTVEQRFAIGAWAGPRVGGEVAVRSISASLEELPHRWALYQRVTLARGLVDPAASIVPSESAVSVDFAVALRRALGPYGVLLQGNAGGQTGHYARWGLELALYGRVL